MSSKVVRFVLCGLLLALMAARCRFPGTVRPTVKIGLVAPFEGRYRYVGYDVIYAVRLALREVDAAGGVGGYSVELVAYDDGADPDLAVEQARKLAVDPELVAVIGHFREETTGAALPVYAAAGLPLIAPALLDDGLTAGPAPVFRLGPPAEAVAREARGHLAALGLRQVALVTEGGPLGRHLQRAPATSQVQIREVASPLDGGWLGQVAASAAEAVFCDLDPVPAGEVALALRGAGWEGGFLGGSELAASDFIAVASLAARGATFVTPWPFPADVSGSAGFVAAYQEVSGGSPPGPLALPAYEATWVLIEALERDIDAHHVPTAAGMAKALLATRRHGLLGRISFDAQRSWSDAPLYWYRVEGQGRVRQVASPGSARPGAIGAHASSRR